MTIHPIYEMPNRCHAYIIEMNVHFPSILRARLMNIRHIELSARLPFHSQWFFFDRNNAGARVLSRRVASVRPTGRARNSARLVLFRWCVCTFDTVDINWRPSRGRPVTATALSRSASQKLGCQIYADTELNAYPFSAGTMLPVPRMKELGRHSIII